MLTIVRQQVMLVCMDEKLLKALGLSGPECKLYRAIAKAGTISPSDLAKATGIKRTTAYSMARGLVEKGLVVEDGTRRPRVFLVSSPEQIQEAIEFERNRSKERQELLATLSEEVTKNNAERTYPVPKIRFIEEDKINAFLHQRTKDWIQSMQETDSVFWGFQDPSLLEHYVEWIDAFWKASPDTFEVKLLTNLSTTEKNIAGRYVRRQTKFWGEDVNFISTTWVIGDYVVILNTRKHPFYVIEIHDKLMAHDQREVYRNLWEMV